MRTILPHWRWELWVLGFGAIALATSLEGGYRIARGIEADVARIRDQLDTRAQRRSLHESIGTLMSEGRALMARCLRAGEPAPMEDANEWARRADDLLRTNFGESYVQRFRLNPDPKDYSVRGAPTEEHNRLYLGIEGRVHRLNEFVAELGPSA